MCGSLDDNFDHMKIDKILDNPIKYWRKERNKVALVMPLNPISSTWLL